MLMRSLSFGGVHTQWCANLAIAGQLAIGCSSNSGGQSGDAPGSHECRANADCQGLADSLIEAIDGARPPEALTRAECVAISLGSGGSTSSVGIGVGEDSACMCSNADESVGYGVGLDPSGCVVRGRTRQCLYEGSEFTGCSVDTADSCSTTCTQLSGLIEADHERDVSANVRTFRCVQNSCKAVVQIDDRCFVNNDHVVHDCTASDEEILSASR
jgi:hypothetical protein